MNIILDVYYNITDIQANYYDKVATGSLFPNTGLSNYYTKIEVDDINNEPSTLILNTYTKKTEADTQLTDYTTITYLQGNYMTTLSITGTLMNNYATIAFIVDNLYGKTYLDNQSSLNADVSELTSLVTADYLELEYTNNVDLTIDCYKKADIDNVIFSSSTGSYVDYNLANKVSTTGDSSISPNLTINGDMDSSKKPPLTIKHSSIHIESWALAPFHQEIENSGSWLQFSRDGTSNA